MEESLNQSESVSFKKFYRNKSNHFIGGVASGIADYFDVPVILPRIIFVLSGFSGFGVLAYLIMWIMVPENPTTVTTQSAISSELSANIYRIGGGLLILFGAYELLDNLNIYWFSDFIDMVSDFAFPVFLIILGALLVYFSVSKIRTGKNEMNTNSTEPKRLYRVMRERMIAGVCSGLGHYFNLDPVLVRVLFIISVFVSFGATLLVYLVLTLATPKDIE